MFNIQSKPPIYDPEAVQPMRDELRFVGFEEATTPSKVDEVLSQKDDKSVLVFLNSVCGCAAGCARPAVASALQHNVIPEKLLTVFAGQDRDAVDLLRSKYLPNLAPSSPMMAIFRNGAPVYVLNRYQIEGREASDIAQDLKAAFETFCTKAGPSITAEKYAELVHTIACGSKIQLNKN